MMIRNIYRLMMAAWLLTACSGNEDLPVVSEQAAVPIGFSALMSVADDDDWPVTRADGEITEGTTSYEFGVFASYTGLHRYSESNVSSDFMYNDRIYKSGTKWTYTPLRFWPNGEGEATASGAELPHYVSFFAYAPYSYSGTAQADAASRAADYCIESFHHASEHTNPWLVYRLHTNVANQVDLLYAQKLDETKKEHPLNTPVGFSFKHALACVGDEVTILLSDAVKNAINRSGNAALKLTDVEITYSLTEKARLILWAASNTANWQPVLSENFLTKRTVSLLKNANRQIYSSNGTLADNVITGKGVFFIPLQVGGERQSADIYVKYAVVQGSATIGTVEGESTLYLDEIADAYEPGKKVKIKITLDNYR
ncbi:MAG: fimbrillin family protein [Bacteroidaceae bacterium]|nr:fimbrillin family protein [Bacteroidaceae bacterium]